MKLTDDDVRIINSNIKGEKRDAHFSHAIRFAIFEQLVINPDARGRIKEAAISSYNSHPKALFFCDLMS